MRIGGLEFPYDHQRDVSAHGPITGFIIRCHPLTMWLPAIVIGIIAGYMLHTPGQFP